MIFPAIDLQNGKSVRLYQGDFAQEMIVNENPVAQAQAINEAGIKGIHLVDLDGAKVGQPQNQGIVAEIVKNFAGETEIGGGIRDEAAIQTYLEFGVDRVILGSVALKDPVFTKAMLAKFGPDRITIGVDGKDGKVATDGWLDQSDTTMVELISAMIKAGANRFIVTDTATDGTLAGPNVTLLKSLQDQFPQAKIVASGGVSNVQDLKALQAAGLNDVVVGKALAAGNITLTEIAEVNANAR